MTDIYADEPIPWGTDGPISLPIAKEVTGVDNPEEVDLGGGFVFTPMGLRHNLTEADREALYRSPYSPGSYRG